jgi:hypothetical protein
MIKCKQSKVGWHQHKHTHKLRATIGDAHGSAYMHAVRAGRMLPANPAAAWSSLWHLSHALRSAKLKRERAPHSLATAGAAANPNQLSKHDFCHGRPLARRLLLLLGKPPLPPSLLCCKSIGKLPWLLLLLYKL